MLTTRCQKVLAIKADGHESLQSLNGCPSVTDWLVGLELGLLDLEISKSNLVKTLSSEFSSRTYFAVSDEGFALSIMHHVIA